MVNTTWTPPKNTTESFRCLDNWVLVKRMEPETQRNGIHVVDPEAQQPKAIVVSVGPGRMLDNGSRARPEFKVGDLVMLYCGIAGQDVELGGERGFFACDVKAIMGVVSPMQREVLGG